MKLNLNAVFNAINQLFSEAVEVTDERLIVKFIESEAGIKPPFYQYQPIDTKNADALRALADKRLSNYLKQHPDNSLQLFVTNEVKTARLYQSYFHKFETDSKQKTYYFRLDRWIDELEKYSPQQVETKKKQEVPETFEQLFYDASFIEPCIGILKDIEPPLIDTESNYIGKLKGVFCVWIDEMVRQGIVKSFSDRKIYSSLLPQKIKRFSIDESMFGKIQSKAEIQHRTDIKTKLSEIKLSLNSQKGKLGK
jgi:hypothetical protein